MGTAYRLNPELEERLLRGERGPYTIEDYLALPEDGPRFQLLRGWLVREPSPLEVHQRVLGNLYVLLRRWVDARQLGSVYLAPFDTALSRYDVVQPDLLFVAAEHRARITRRRVEGAPDLVVEILSPSTGKRDRTVKLELYAEAGVREAWLVDPDGQAVDVIALEVPGRPVFRFTGHQSPRSRVLGDLDFAVQEIFA